jgi:hypothetical protein
MDTPERGADQRTMPPLVVVVVLGAALAVPLDAQPVINIITPHTTMNPPHPRTNHTGCLTSLRQRGML